MSEDRYRVIIIGAGPAGISAATRAAELGLNHLLLEATAQLANTTYCYQRGKHVMAEPEFLPLHGTLPFQASTREQILESWNETVSRNGVQVRFNSDVKAVVSKPGGFQVELADGNCYHADKVILAIGLQGNLRKLCVEGESLSFVQYQLADPDEYQDETITVIGAGDAAIENALALASRNRVTIVNRRDEFVRAKEANLARITEAIENGMKLKTATLEQFPCKPSRVKSRQPCCQ